MLVKIRIKGDGVPELHRVLRSPENFFSNRGMTQDRYSVIAKVKSCVAVTPQDRREVIPDYNVVIEFEDTMNLAEPTPFSKISHVLEAILPYRIS